MTWGGWSIEPPMAYVAIAAILYWVGGRDYSRGGRQPLRAASFAAGLATIVLALESPLDGYADQLFWAHMLQHVLLLTVAPPLILLGRPWPRMWLALPLRSRTTIGRALASARWAAPVRAVARPLPAWLLFNAAIVGWHIPGAYNATLQSSAIHDLEHITFYATALLFWAHALAVPPLRTMLDWPRRAAFVAGAMVAGWVLALVFALARHPLYAAYAHLAHRPGGLSALADQQLAAGMMWVPGSISFTIAFIYALYRWLEPQRERAAASAMTI